MSFLASMLTGGGLGAGFSDQSTNTNTTQNTNYNANSTGTVNRNLTPFQTNLQSPLFSYIQQLMTPEGAAAAVKPFYQGARDSTNQNYAGLADTLRQQFLGTGNGASGKFGNSLVQGNLQRLGDLSKVDNTAATTAAELPLQASSLAEQLLGMNFGQTSTGTSSATSNTTGTSKTDTSGFSLKI